MSTQTEAEMRLIPQLQAMQERVATLRQQAESRTQGLSVAQMNWSPAADRWSIAQCLDHLAKTGVLLLPHFETAIQQLEAQGQRSEGPFRYSLLERWVIRVLSPDPPIKLPVPR